MSWQATTWVSSEVRGLTLAQRAVLLTMANYAQPDGTGVFVGQKRLATEVEISVKSVRRVQQSLERMGVLSRGDQALGIRGLRNPRWAPIVWDLCMTGSRTHSMVERGMPPIGGPEDDDSPEHGVHELPDLSDRKFSQVSRGDSLSPLLDQGKQDLVLSQVSRGDKLSPLPDQGKQESRTVDLVGPVVEGTQRTGRGDTWRPVEGTPGDLHNNQRTTKEQPPPTTAPAAAQMVVVVVDDVRMFAAALLRRIPESVRRQLGVRTVLDACRPLVGTAVEPAQLGRAAAAHAWDGAGPGAVISWLRGEVAELITADASVWPSAETKDSSDRPAWCEECDDEHTRWRESPDGGLMPCPVCNPRARTA